MGKLQNTENNALIAQFSLISLPLSQNTICVQVDHASFQWVSRTRSSSATMGPNFGFRLVGNSLGYVIAII